MTFLNLLFLVQVMFTATVYPKDQRPQVKTEQQKRAVQQCIANNRKVVKNRRALHIAITRCKRVR